MASRIGSSAVTVRRIVVAVRLDRASTQGLSWAHSLGRHLGLDVEVVHVLSAPVDADGAGGLAGRIQQVRIARAAVQEWALSETGIALPGPSVHVRFGDIARQVADTARRCDATLVVVGGPLDDDDGAGALTADIIAAARRPVFVAGPKRCGGAFLVATDLEQFGAPVLHVGARYARRLGRRLSVIHHLDGLRDDDDAVPEQREHAEEDVAIRLGTLRHLAQKLRADDATVTRSGLPGDGILRVARARDVDVVVIGVRSDAGLTSRWVLAAARRSVLTVPIT